MADLLKFLISEDQFKSDYEYQHGHQPSHTVTNSFRREIFSDSVQRDINFIKQLVKNGEMKQKKEKGQRIQSLLFNKNVYKAKEECVAWMKRQNEKRGLKVFDWGNYDPPNSPTEQYHRFRQFSPSKSPGARFRTGQIDTGIKAVYEFHGPPPN